MSGLKTDFEGTDYEGIFRKMSQPHVQTQPPGMKMTTLQATRRREPIVVGGGPFVSSQRPASLLPKIFSQKLY